MNYPCLIYFKENPTELEITLRMYENPRNFILYISSYSLIANMGVQNASDVSVNWKGIKKCSE